MNEEEKKILKQVPPLIAEHTMLSVGHWDPVGK